MSLGDGMVIYTHKDGGGIVVVASNTNPYATLTLKSTFQKNSEAEFSRSQNFFFLGGGEFNW